MTRFRFLLLRWMAARLPATRAFRAKSWFLRLGGVEIDRSARLHSSAHFETSFVSVGADSWVGRDVLIVGSPTAWVRIGARVDIAPRVAMVTGTHDLGASRRRAGNGRSEEIVVGDGVWIGAGALVLGGVKIGGGAVVAAGAVVVKDVPNDVLVGGVPATVLRTLP